MAEEKITEKFLRALDRYLRGELLMDKAMKEADLKTRKQFLDRMRIAYSRNMLIVRSYIDSALGTKIREAIGPAKRVEAYVVKGVPDDNTFFDSAAERFLIFLKKLLLCEEKSEINIGIVSGTNTVDLIDHASEIGLWQEVMEGLEFKNKKKRKINIVALCSTTLDGWDLEGNANISTLRLAKILKNRLPDFFDVIPYGITTEMVVSSEAIKEVDNRVSNKEKLKIIDPRRIEPGSKEGSKLDILVTGVGIRTYKENPVSVFQKVVESENINLPQEVVGDVGFWPVNSEGKEIELYNKDNKKISLYSLITLKTMRELSKGHGIVMLIARNHRRGNLVPKTIPIRAAIRGGYVNVLFTDEDTANEILKDLKEPL